MFHLCALYNVWRSPLDRSERKSNSRRTGAGNDIDDRDEPFPHRRESSLCRREEPFRVLATSHIRLITTSFFFDVGTLHSGVSQRL